MVNVEMTSTVFSVVARGCSRLFTSRPYHMQVFNYLCICDVDCRQQAEVSLLGMPEVEAWTLAPVNFGSHGAQ